MSMSNEHTPPTEAELDEWERNQLTLSEPDDPEKLRCIREVRRLRAERSAVWLIEHIRGANGAPLWWCGSIPSFSADPNSAVRFVRERDAHVVMVQENIQNACRATEHVFLDAARQEPTP